jgi:sulfite exporter TauE/SafE
MTPCAIALGALVYAGLAGSALGGAQVMAGFALGTLPAVVASASGVGALKTLTRSPRARVGAGLALVMIGALSGLPVVEAAIFCRP